MTSKTSLFNKGIYVSTLKRFKWGSLLYFVILFMITSLLLILTTDTKYRLSADNSFLYDGEWIIPSVITGMLVSTVVGMLVFRFLHSKKSAVFTHSLPVCRASMYISTVLASLTLMLAPIILNGIVLLIMALTSFSRFITVGSCFVWVGINMLCIFLMFSCTCLVSVITGNSFAVVGLNILFHSIVPLVTVLLGAVARYFLYGFSDISEAIERVSYGNFPAWLVWLSGNVNERVVQCFATKGFLSRFIGYILIAILFYVIAMVLYKKRNIENAEDVAGFKCLNPIFKYIVTFLGTLGMFAIMLGNIKNTPAAFTAVVLITSAILYFGAEMVLKKTFKVIKSYRGYVVFIIAFGLMICVFAFTSFFGYETYVPNAEEVEGVAVYDYHNNGYTPFVSKKEVIDYTINMHKGFLSDEKMYIIEDFEKHHSDERYSDRITVEYKMKDGNVVERMYWLSNSEFYAHMTDLYKFESVKYESEPVLYNQEKRLYRIYLSSGLFGCFDIEDEAAIKEFYQVIIKDIEGLDYNQIYLDGASMYSAGIEWVTEEEDGRPRTFYSEHYSINSNFKNTLKWIEDMGYGSYSENTADMNVYVKYQNIKADFDYNKFDYSDAVPLVNEPLAEDLVYKVMDDDVEIRIIEYLKSDYFEYAPDKEYFLIEFGIDKQGIAVCGLVEKEKIREFLSYIFN